MMPEKISISYVEVVIKVDIRKTHTCKHLEIIMRPFLMILLFTNFRVWLEYVSVYKRLL
jgi:hypothetical protein